jgi:hypothetical protein
MRQWRRHRAVEWAARPSRPREVVVDDGGEACGTTAMSLGGGGQRRRFRGVGYRMVDGGRDSGHRRS